MEFIFEIIFQFFGELLVSVLFEGLSELGEHSLKETFRRKPKHPFLSMIGYSLWGAIAGGISFLILPNSFIDHAHLRIANLLLTPVLIGCIMMYIGKLRTKKGQKLVKLDRFGYAFCFAFAMALVRFVWAV